MKYTLNERNIDTVCTEASAFLVRRKTNSKDLILTKLSIEEVLLTYLSAFGSDVQFSVDYGGGLTKSKIRLTVPGPSLDPFASKEAVSDEELLLSNVLSRMGQYPRWKYARGINTIIFTPAKKSLPDLQKLLIAIISAIVFGLAVRALPANLSMFLQQEVMAPLLDTFLNFLNAIAGPMIFLSVVWGIYSIGDASTFSEIGRRICVSFLLFLCITTTLVALVSLPFFSLTVGNAQGGNQFSQLYRMVLDIVPGNLFTPFSRGNTLQIMFVGIIVGVTMLLISKDTQIVARLAEQLGFIVDGIMSFISRLVPVFVFGSLFNIIASSNLASLAAGGKFFAATLAGCVLLLIFHTAVGCVGLNMSPFDLWKRTFSTFIIALSTASSSAAFADNKRTCTEELGISQRLANFGVPFGQLLYPPGSSVLFWFAAVSVAESSGIEVSMVWYVTAVVVSIILSLASPPVPGGMTASFAILFAQLGLPVSDLAVIVSLTSILDFVTTATSVQGGQCILAITAKRIEKQ